MAHGKHAQARSQGPVTTAARKSLVRTGAFTGALALSWAAVTALSGQGYLDAFADQPTSSARNPSGIPADQIEEIKALNAEYDCSYRGPGADVIPARAVVLVDREVRLATFDEGWSIHLGEAPGTLVSLCAH